MNREIVDYDNKKYIKEVTLYFNEKDKNDIMISKIERRNNEKDNKNK